MSGDARPISSVFNFDESKLGDTMREAARVYHSIFDQLPKDKRVTVEQICHLFTESAAAYSSIFKFKGDTRTDTQRICQVAGHAQQYMIHFQNLRDLFKSGDDKVLDVVDKTSEWLKSKGWFGLPTPSDENGVKVYKTASGVHKDMKLYIESYNKMMFQLCGITEQGRRR